MDEDIASSAAAHQMTVDQGATAAAVEQAEAAQSSQVSDEEVKTRLLVLLGNSDLTTTTGDWMGVVDSCSSKQAMCSV
jgi:hypothetical protein